MLIGRSFANEDSLQKWAQIHHSPLAKTAMVGT
jgi:hypothetical protein